MGTNMKKIIITSLFFVILFIQISSSLTGVSNSYSVSMFGNGIVNGKGYSENFNFTFLSETGGTTRNAESSLFTLNIGFFENTQYSRTVSISSYSISPRTTVVGSTIGLSISALNYQNVWAIITSPNSQQQTLNLVNGQTVNYVPSHSVVGRYEVVFYANGSTGAIASVLDSFELTQQVSSGSGSSGGGSGGTNIIQRCNYNWDCTPWSICSENVQIRLCKNIGTCVGNESKPIEEMQCSESLFDIGLRLGLTDLIDKNNLKFNINLTEMIGVEKIDVHIKYLIIDENGYEVFSQIETKAIEKNLFYEKTLDNLNLVNGDYILRVDILYGNLQRAFAEQKFSILNQESLAEVNSGITGFAWITNDQLRNLALSFTILVLSIGGLIFIHLKKGRLRNKPTNLLSNVLGLEVYTGNGLKIGCVYEIMIRDNKIYGLMVVVDSNAPVSTPRVMIRYEFIQSIKDVVVVNSMVVESNKMGASG